MSAAEEEARLERIRVQREQNVERYHREWDDLTDEEVIAELIPAPADVIVQLVIQQRLLASLSSLQRTFKRAERLSWALVFLTLVLLVVTAVLAIDVVRDWFD